MTDRPILFNADMIRALLDGRKTQTRRILKPQPPEQTYLKSKLNAQSGQVCVFGHPLSKQQWKIPLRVQLNDRFWAREAWSGEYVFRDSPPSKRKPLDTGHGTVAFPKTIHYWADGDPEFGDWERGRPSIHMPRWASRLTLIVTDVRVQRLQDISETDAVAEGAAGFAYEVALGEGTGTGWCCSHGQDLSHRPNERMFDTARESYADLWNSAYGPKAWDANPWVSATTFTVHRCNIDQMEAA